MNLIDKTLQLLRKPFPVQENKAQSLRTIAYVSIFVTLFLYIFQPFGISGMESGQFLICLGFGMMTFLACVFYDLVVSRILGLSPTREDFSFGWWILHMTGIMLMISVFNFLFVRLYFFGSIRWEFLPDMIYGTFAIGLFPVVVIGGLAMLRQENKYRHVAEEINRKKAGAPGVDHGTDQTLFGIPLDRARFVEALQNYVKIGYVETGGEFAEQTERATLKSIEDEMEGGFIVRCHRSYLVNRDAITGFDGNAQGLVLSLSGCEKTVPVSRSYVPVFRDS